MSRSSYQELRLTQEAADWLARLESGERDCYPAFLDWVRQSPVHVREFLAVSDLSRRLTGIDPQRRRDVRKLAARSDSNVVPLKGDLELSPSPPAGARARWIAFAASAAILIGTTFVYLAGSHTRQYVTGVGEQRFFKLDDGSLIHLNTKSGARVRYDDHARTIELTHGEALFVVAQDSARPFRVLAGAAVIEALGTQFNVYRQTGGTKVAVVEGRVRLSGGDAIDSAAEDPTSPIAGAALPRDEQVFGHPQGSTAALSAGESARVDGRGAITDIRKESAAVSQAIAWRQRLLQFKETRLAEAAAEFNRYNSLQIQVTDEGVGDRRVTGFFNVDNPEGLLRFLETDPSLRIVRHGPDISIEPR